MQFRSGISGSLDTLKIIITVMRSMWKADSISIYVNYGMELTNLCAIIT